MKKIIFITFLWLYPTLVFSAIDERKIDVYFANGIKTSDDEAWKNTYRVLKPAINKDLFENNETRMKKYIGKFDYAYNSTHGMFMDKDGGFDLLESFLQKLSLQNPLDDLINILILRMVETAHDTDLRDQVQTYKDSIEAGHKVLVVAHSQGNLFTYEAYRELDVWMQEYFYAISIASPGNDFIKEGTPRISWDNDLVAHLGLYDGLLENPVRKVGWRKLSDQIPLSDKSDKPYSDYLYKEQIGGVFNGVYESSEETTLLGLIPIGLIDSNVHAFSFYMGANLKNSDEVIQINGLNIDETLHTNIARDKIIDEIRKGLLKLELLPSQWKVKQTIGCGCDQKVSLQHIEPAANLDHLMEGTKVLEFNLDGKLYQLPDETNTSMIWVKGSTTGVSIENVQKKLPNICYQLTGTNEIIKGSQNPNPHDGLLRVVLDWTNNAIDLNLNVVGPTPGVKEEHPDYACPRENWYIENESGLAEGHYIVSVTAPSNVDESLMPEQIRLDVKAEGKGEHISFDINNTLMLNLGEVYDINVTFKDIGSGGGSTINIDGHRTSSSGRSVTYLENDEGTIYTADLILLLKQLALGPIAGASLLLEKLNSGEWQELYTGVTTSGATINSNGLIIFPSTLQTAVFVDDILLLTASGGQDVDADDDFNLDVIPTTVLGKLHAFMDSENVTGNRLKVNILTEIVYQAVYKRVNTDTTKTELISMLDNVTKLLIKNDLNGDAVISYKDATSWLAGFDKEVLYFDYNEKIEPIVQKIYHNEDIYLDVYRLLYAGKVDGINIDDSETVKGINLNLNSYVDFAQLQKEDFVLKDSNDNIVDFTLAIIDGSVVINPLNSLVEGQSYTLQFNLEIYDSQDNIYLDMHRHTFIVPDNTPPVIPESTIHVDENGATVPVNAIDLSTPLKYTINGGADKDRFEVKSRYYNYVYNDYISFKETPNYERPADSNSDNIYELEVSVADSFSNITIQSIRIIIDDVTEGPQLADTYLNVDENSLIGTYVGNMAVVNEGDGNLTEFFVYGQATEDFRIDNSGKIYTTKLMDYERLQAYSFKIRAGNSVNAYSNVSDVKVNVNDIEELLPIVHSFTGSMDDHAPEGKMVGQLYIYSGLESAVQVRLIGDGAEDFDVNASGHITVSATADLDHHLQKQYDLKAIASNSYGDSEEADVTIYINVWTKQYGTAQKDYGNTVATDLDGNIYLVGRMDTDYGLGNDFFLSKFNSSGELLWSKEYNQSEKINVASMTVGKNGTIYLAGSKATGGTYVRYSRTYDKYAAWISAVSSSGELLWTKLFDVGANGQDNFMKIVTSYDGDLLISGRTGGAFTGFINRGYDDIVVVKLSVLGDIKWINQFGTYGYDYPKSMKLNSNNELFLLSQDNTLMQLSQGDGTVLLEVEFPSPNGGPYDRFIDFSIDKNNNIYLLGERGLTREWTVDDKTYSESDYDCIVTKVDQNIEKVWSKSYGSNRWEFPRSIAVNSKNEIYFTGDTWGSLYDNINKKPYVETEDVSDFFLMNIDLNGEIVNSRQHGSIEWDGINTMEIDINDDIYLTGYVRESLDGNAYIGESDIFLMKIPY